MPEDISLGYVCSRVPKCEIYSVVVVQQVTGLNFARECVIYFGKICVVNFKTWWLSINLLQWNPIKSLKVQFLQATTAFAKRYLLWLRMYPFSSFILKYQSIKMSALWLCNRLWAQLCNGLRARVCSVLYFNRGYQNMVEDHITLVRGIKMSTLWLRNRLWAQLCNRLRAQISYVLYLNAGFENQVLKFADLL